MIHLARHRNLLLSAVSAATLAGLTGCSMSSAPSAPVTFQGSTLQGRVKGGQQPVGGATIQLYATGATGLRFGIETDDRLQRALEP